MVLAGVEMLEFSLKNSAVVKIVSLLLVERTSPRLVILLFGAFAFAPVGVRFKTPRLPITNGQHLLGVFDLRLFAFSLTLGFLGLFLSFFLLLLPTSRVPLLSRSMVRFHSTASAVVA